MNKSNIYKTRRNCLLQMIQEQYPKVTKGVIVLCATFENDKYLFCQESSFYYLTGIKEPGVVFCLYLDGHEEVFIPNYGETRSQWVTTTIGEQDLSIKKLGAQCSAYWLKPFFYKEEYEQVILSLQEYCDEKTIVFSLLDQANDHYFVPMYRFKNIISCVSIVPEKIANISSFVAHMRSCKDKTEVALMQKAVDITCYAHKVAAQYIKHGLYEYELQSEIEKVFTAHHAQGPAFPSIVATGKNTTVLHYMARNQKLMAQDLVVVDIGAQVENYCADITRTYSVGGKFTSRQREIYNIVLEVQEYVAQQAKPGMFLCNPAAPEDSLHHLAVAFLTKRGYGKYFVHGIGHFLGLDVHDVGNATLPLEVGMVFTIEPGVYIPQENIGIRIEDDFIITSHGCRCLSDKLGKNIEDIEIR